ATGGFTRDQRRLLHLARDGRRAVGRRWRGRRRRVDLAAGRARMVPDRDLAAGPARGTRVEAAVVEVQVPRDGGPDEPAGLDPEHRPDDEVKRVRLVEVRVAVVRA